MAELDFGRLGFIQDPETGRRCAVWALIVVLAHSRHSFVWPTYSQKLEEVIAGLEAAWAFFGGIPKYLVIDNFPAAVAGADSLHPRLTRGFLEYSQHRGFITDPARVRHPKDKPKVERGVQYVRERFFKGGDFKDLTHLRSEAARWCRDVAGLRIHGTTRRQPLQVFLDEERPALNPWDGEPYEVTHWRTAKVHPDHHVAGQYALYSVPSTRCPPGQQVEIGLGLKLVRIYHRGRLVKVHPRQPRGGRATDAQDYPAELSAYTLRAPDGIKRSAAEPGPAVAEFAERLFDGPLPWAKVRQGHKLIRLGQRYTPERLDSACRRALEVDLIDVRRVERILLQALEQSRASGTSPSTARRTLRPPGQRLRPCKRPSPSVNRVNRIENRRSIMTRIPELTPLLKRLQLGPMAATLPERIALARRDQLDYASFLEIILSDEVNRRADRRLELRLHNAGFEETCRLEDFDWSSAISLDRRLLDAVFSMEFLARHEHVLLVGPAGVGKTFLAQALGYTAVRAGHTVRFCHADDFFRSMTQARVDNSVERTFRSFLSPDLLILDDLGLHRLTAQQSADLYELIISRHRVSSFVITSNRAVEEWLSLFDDSILGNSALDRLANASFQIVIEGASYREKLSPHRKLLGDRGGD